MSTEEPVVSEADESTIERSIEQLVQLADEAREHEWNASLDEAAIGLSNSVQAALRAGMEEEASRAFDEFENIVEEALAEEPPREGAWDVLGSFGWTIGEVVSSDEEISASLERRSFELLRKMKDRALETRNEEVFQTIVKMIGRAPRSAAKEDSGN